MGTYARGTWSLAAFLVVGSPMLAQAQEELAWSLALEGLEGIELADQLPAVTLTHTLEEVTAAVVAASPEMKKLALAVEEARILETLGGRERAAGTADSAQVPRPERAPPCSSVADDNRPPLGGGSRSDRGSCRAHWRPGRRFVSAGRVSCERVG